MSSVKIKYHKLCHKHSEVEKVKRQLVKAYKIADSLSYIYASITLTGIEDLDYKEIRSYYQSEYVKLRDRITKDIEDDKEYNHGFNLSSKIIVLKFLQELNTALSLTAEYPQIPFKVKDYHFKSDNVHQRKDELKKHFTNGEKERRLYSLTFQSSDLLYGQILRVKYQ